MLVIEYLLLPLSMLCAMKYIDPHVLDIDQNTSHDQYFFSRETTHEIPHDDECDANLIRTISGKEIKLFRTCH